MRATTRFREYLPAALYAQRDEVTRVGPIAEGQAMEVGADTDLARRCCARETPSRMNTVVLSTAPPDEPRVVYVVPTFRWSDAPGNNTLDTTRYGNGLRVWLERPWFSSGDGELLGVVILGQDKKFTEITQAMMPYVTQWGLDPLWDTALPKYRTRVTDFPARVADEVVSLRERDNTSVHVIGHRVYWDESRRMWYSDIELDPGASYMPFVRLALVRYQPNSLPDAKISKVFLTDFAQVLPRRRAVFQRSGAQLTFRIARRRSPRRPNAVLRRFRVHRHLVSAAARAAAGERPQPGGARHPDARPRASTAISPGPISKSSPRPLVPPPAPSGIAPPASRNRHTAGRVDPQRTDTVRDGLGRRMQSARR